jgi:hypothetical protein
MKSCVVVADLVFKIIWWLRAVDRLQSVMYKWSILLVVVPHGI